MTEEELDVRLDYWVREYGGGSYGDSGGRWNIIQALMAHRGFVPSARGYINIPLRTWADDVEKGVVDMENTPGVAGTPNACFVAAKVLRVHYFLGTGPNGWRTGFLHEMGVNVTRYRYYKALEFGRLFIWGYLNAVELEKHSVKAA